MNLRPSSLPKLAQCAKYESNPDAGAAAQRGTDMDASFRAIIRGTHVAWVADADKEDIAAVEWAVATARLYAGSAHLEADENHLRVEVLGMTGTADASCTEREWSADLKTGEQRNYVEQQAAYALGFMDKEFTDQWTVHLLYCDLRLVETLEFTRESAEQIVRGVLSKAKDPEARATPCDYCDWCALRWTCKTRLEPLSMLLTGAPDKLDIPGISEDPAMLGAVLAITHEVSKDNGLHDTLKDACKTHLEAGREVPGWSLSKGRETRTVDNVTVARFANDFGIGRVMEAYGSMSEKKFSGLWSHTFGNKPLPDDAVTVNHGNPFVTKKRASKVK